MLWGFFWRRFAFISFTCLCPLLGRSHFNYTSALSFSHHEMESFHTANLYEASSVCKISGEAFSFYFYNSPWTVGVARNGFIYHLSLYAMLKFIDLVVLYLSRKSPIKFPSLGGLLPFLSFFLHLLWFSKKQDHNVLKFNMLVKCFEINNLLISLASLFCSFWTLRFLTYTYIYIISHIYSYPTYIFILYLYIYFTLNVFIQKFYLFLV